jgi:hypothetical protein
MYAYTKEDLEGLHEKLLMLPDGRFIDSPILFLKKSVLTKTVKACLSPDECMQLELEDIAKEFDEAYPCIIGKPVQSILNDIVKIKKCVDVEDHDVLALLNLLHGEYYYLIEQSAAISASRPRPVRDRSY